MKHQPTNPVSDNDDNNAENGANANESHVPSRWPNEALAQAVRAAFIKKRWRTIEEAHKETGISTNVLVNLRHGRSVHPSSLMRFAEAVDGPGSIEKWVKMADGRPKFDEDSKTEDIKRDVKKVDEAILRAALEPQNQEILVNMRHFSGREKMALQFLTSCIADRIDPINQLYEQTDYLRPARVNFKGLHPAPTIRTLAYLGPDAPGLISVLTKAVSDAQGHILEIDSLFRSRVGSIYICFYTLGGVSEDAISDVVGDARTSIADMIHDPDRTKHTLLLKREEVTKQTVDIFSGNLRLNESADNLSQVLQLIKEYEFNVINLVQRPEDTKEQKRNEETPPHESRVVLYMEPAMIDMGNLTKLRERVIKLQLKIEQFPFVTYCSFSHVGETFYASESGVTT